MEYFFGYVVCLCCAPFSAFEASCCVVHHFVVVFLYMLPMTSIHSKLSHKSVSPFSTTKHPLLNDTICIPRFSCLSMSPS